jgi:lysophospholipase L1-like esterase
MTSAPFGSWRPRVVVYGATALVLGLLPFTSHLVEAGTAAAARSPAPVYYLAMGDSMAAGTGASTTASRYVNVLYDHELTRIPNLQLDNIACGGATTGSVINGPGCSYTTGTQLGDAESFLRAHSGHVAFVTIDIGANNVDSCQTGPSTISTTCLENGLSDITSQLPQILSGLVSAYPGVAIYGMNYYDPFLGEWMLGSSGQMIAQESENDVGILNTLLAQLYAAGGASTADPASLFQTTDFDPTGSYLGQTEPQNVADICNWTLFCSDDGNIHPNDTGHALVASAFGRVIDGVTVSSVPLPAATIKERYSGQLLALGGHPRYRWSLVQGSTPLPPGLRLRANGTFAGKPTTTGSYTFRVGVTDTQLPIPKAPAKNQATGTVSITVDSGS